jgi:hypothetical protein
MDRLEQRSRPGDSDLLFFRAFYFSLLLCWIFRMFFQNIISSLWAIMLFLNNSMGTATEQQRCWTKQRPIVGQ